MAVELNFELNFKNASFRDSSRLSTKKGGFRTGIAVPLIAAGVSL